MSEKRFTIHELVHYDEEQEKWVDCDRYCITDNETHINYDLKFNERQLCDLLNEQSERIKSLEMELDLIANTKLFSRRKLEEENEQMKKQLEKIPKSIREVWLE